MKKTLPMMSFRGTSPQTRESQEWARLSPSIRYMPDGIRCNVPTGGMSASVFVSLSRRFGCTYDSVSRLRLMYCYPFRCCQTSPGRPIMRLTEIATEHYDLAAG